MIYLISDYAEENDTSHGMHGPSHGTHTNPMDSPYKPHGPHVDLIEDDGRLGIFVNDELIESYTEDSETTPIGKILQRLTTIRDLAEKGLLG